MKFKTIEKKKMQTSQPIIFNLLIYIFSSPSLDIEPTRVNGMKRMYRSMMMVHDRDDMVSEGHPYLDCRLWNSFPLDSIVFLESAIQLSSVTTKDALWCYLVDFRKYSNVIPRDIGSNFQDLLPNR